MNEIHTGGATVEAPRSARHQGWRSVLKVHPAADLFPPMSAEELKALSEDIKRNGLQTPPVLWSETFSSEQQLLDGRNRLDAMELAGMRILKDGRLWYPNPTLLDASNCDPYAYVVSANIHRRHLTGEQKREVIAKLLKADPAKSNRQIAEPLKVSHHTVGSVRADLEATGQIAQLRKTIGADGKARRQPIRPTGREPSVEKTTELDRRDEEWQELLAEYGIKADSDRSKKKDTVAEVMDHANRPEERAHAKQLRTYLLNTACTGDKFVLPSFTFNYGVGLDDDAPDATLIVFATGGDGSNAWPGILLLPRGARLDTTDGAHRRSKIADILADAKVSTDEKDSLKRNAVDVKIIFEASRSDSHQDFADCGKAKAIPKSMVTTFDVRDRRNQRSRELVKNSPFLAANVDATASNVNLSAKSRMIWSMSAVRMFVAHVMDHHPGGDSLSETEKTEGAEEFFAALVRHHPQLHALDKARRAGNSEVTTGSLRDVKGGNVALRGVGMAIFARAFLYCKTEGMDFEVMAAKLAQIDWHLLACEKSELPTGPTYASEVQRNSQPTWAHLLVIGDSKYRVSSSSEDADEAWERISRQVLEERKAA